MLPDNLLPAPSVMSASLEQLFANLGGDVASRIQSAASISVISAHDLARRHKTMSAASSYRAPEKKRSGVRRNKGSLKF